MSACKLRPPYRIDRFQSLLDPRPHKFSNSLGVNHWSLNFIQRPRPPEPNRDLYNSAVVVLQRTGNTSRFIVSFQLVVHRAVVSVIVVDSWVFVAPAIDSVACCWMTMCVAFMSPSPTTAFPEMKPLLSTHNICLKCGNWSGVMTLNAVPINEPIGRDTGTETTVLPASDVATKRVVRGATFNEMINEISTDYHQPIICSYTQHPFNQPSWHTVFVLCGFGTKNRLALRHKHQLDTVLCSVLFKSNPVMIEQLRQSEAGGWENGIFESNSERKIIKIPADFEPAFEKLVGSAEQKRVKP